MPTSTDENFSKFSYVFTGGSQAFEAPFALGVLTPGHIQAFVEGELDGLGEQIYRPFTWDAITSTVTITSTITANVGNPATVVVQRTVPKDVLYISFASGADVTKTNIDTAMKYTLMALHETLDGRWDSAAWDALNNSVQQAISSAALAQAGAAVAVLYSGGAFASRDFAIAAVIPAPVIAISVLHAGEWLHYRYDPSGTALTTADGRNWSPANTATPKHWGAMGDNVTDDLAAFNAATAWWSAGGVFEVTPGYYRLSGTWVIKNKYRSKLRCDGVLKPHGAFSDFLVWFTNDVGDPLVTSMGQQITLESLQLDCEWKSRGVKFEKQYDSSLSNVQVWRCYGTGISCPMVQEVSFYQPMIISSKARFNATILAAPAYSGATAYVVGDYIKRTYPVYNAGTAYVAGNLVASGGFLFRALLSSTGATPTLTANADKWEQIPWEYFQAIANSTGKDPHHASTDYTTRSGVSGDRYWKPVYADEAAWEFVGNGSDVTIDNPKIFGFITRANEHNTIIRVDAAENSFRAAKIEFYGGQFHALASAYITAFNANPAMTGPYGGTITAPTEGKLIHLVSATGFKVVGGQMQVGDLSRCKAVLCGTLGISGNAAKSFFIGTQIEGTLGGEAQVGISILPSVETAGGNWVQTGVNFALPGTGSVTKIDLGGETEYFQAGTLTIPAGATSLAVVFPRPFAGTPVLSVDAKANIGGLSYHLTALSNTGFTITLAGQFHGPMQSTAFTAAGGVNQVGTYTPNLTQADSYTLLGCVGDPGATYRVCLNTNSGAAIAIKAPGAPSVDVTQNWAAIWDAKCPTAAQFGWFAEMEPDA